MERRRLFGLTIVYILPLAANSLTVHQIAEIKPFGDKLMLTCNVQYVTHRFMYTKLFGRILDSSVWLEDTSTRIVWITLLAAMDEDGYAHFAAVDNLAIRARVSIAEAQHAVDCFLAPDPKSSNPENEGRRIELVPGGFLILNAGHYKSIVKRLHEREQTRERVARHRAKKRRNSVTALPNRNQSQDADADADADSYSDPILTPTQPALLVFPTAGKPKSWPLTRSTVDLLKSAFPALDVFAECKRALAWCQTNAQRQKTARGMPAFLNNWLARSQNRDVTKSNGGNNGPSWPTTPEEQAQKDEFIRTHKFWSMEVFREEQKAAANDQQ